MEENGNNTRYFTCLSNNQYLGYFFTLSLACLLAFPSHSRFSFSICLPSLTYFPSPERSKQAQAQPSLLVEKLSLVAEL